MDTRDLSDSVDGNDTELRRALSETQPRWLKDGLGIRGAEKQEIAQQVRQEWPDPVVNYKEAARPSVTQPISTVRPLQNVTSGDTSFPFKVVRTKDEADVPVLVVTPGKIAQVMPTYQGIALDFPSFQPKIYPLSKAQFQIALKCNIDLTDPAVHYRSYIKFVEVKLDDEIDGTDYTDEGRLNEYHIVWDKDLPDNNSRFEKGYFWILVANVNQEQDEDDNWVITSIDQSLRNNLLTFAIVGDVAMVLAKE